MPSRTLQTPAGEVYETDGLLDYGEHAEIWRVKGRADLVAKVFFAELPDAATLEPKVRAMIASPPARSEHLTWPIEVLHERGHFVGYLMPRIAEASAVHYAAGAMRGRAQDFPRETTRDALRHGAELARLVAQVHHAGHTLGHFSSEMLLWRADGGLAVTGTEAFCIRAPDGTVYPPRVPPLEFIAPELRGLREEKLAWSAAQDAYALAVHLQHLLRACEANLPREIRRSFRRAESAQTRAGAAEWGALLETAELAECAACGNIYAHELRRCPRCSAPSEPRSTRSRLIKGLAVLGLAAIILFTVFQCFRAQLPSVLLGDKALPAQQKPSREVNFQPGRRYSLTLGLDAGSPRPQIIERGDNRVILEARDGSLLASWPSGAAVLAAGEAGTFEQKPNPATWVEGWRDLRLTFAPERQWDAIYRVPWVALGLTVGEGPGFPRLRVAVVADDSPASDAKLVPGERMAMPELRSVAEPSEGQFRSALEKLAGSAVTLRVFSGEPTRLEGYIASGEFRPKIVAGEYLKVEAVGGGSRAQIAGLRAGDVVTAISGQSTRLLAGPAVEKLLNRKVTLEVYREAQVRTAVLARDRRVRVSFSAPERQ